MSFIRLQSEMSEKKKQKKIKHLYLGHWKYIETFHSTNLALRKRSEQKNSAQQLEVFQVRSRSVGDQRKAPAFLGLGSWQTVMGTSWEIWYFTRQNRWFLHRSKNMGKTTCWWFKMAIGYPIEILDARTSPKLCGSISSLTIFDCTSPRSTCRNSRNSPTAKQAQRKRRISTPLLCWFCCQKWV